MKKIERWGVFFIEEGTGNEHTIKKTVRVIESDLDAQEAYIKQLEENQKWISVKDELPKTEGKKRIKYLCWNHDGQFVTEWREYATGTEFDESFGSVLFWKPLPNPPQETE